LEEQFIVTFRHKCCGDGQ